MRTIEFFTQIKNGIIKIPEIFNKDINNRKVKILINIDIDTKTNYDINKIEKVLEKIKAKNIFKNIEEPVKWQKGIRDEWE